MQNKTWKDLSEESQDINTIVKLLFTSYKHLLQETRMPEEFMSSEERKELMTAIQDHVYQNAIRKLAKEIASTSPILCSDTTFLFGHQQDLKSELDLYKVFIDSASIEDVEKNIKNSNELKSYLLYRDQDNNSLSSIMDKKSIVRLIMELSKELQEAGVIKALPLKSEVKESTLKGLAIHSEEDISKEAKQPEVKELTWGALMTHVNSEEEISFTK